jgi:hypothetical protein
MLEFDYKIIFSNLMQIPTKDNLLAVKRTALTG